MQHSHKHFSSLLRCFWQVTCALLTGRNLYFTGERDDLCLLCAQDRIHPHENQWCPVLLCSSCNQQSPHQVWPWGHWSSRCHTGHKGEFHVGTKSPKMSCVLGRVTHPEIEGRAVKAKKKLVSLLPSYFFLVQVSAANLCVLT